MGWSNCGTDSKDRPIGYGFSATCDHPGCKTKIDRGLSYACGGMHGELDYACEGYFCASHRNETLLVDGRLQNVCRACYNAWKKYAVENPDDASDLVRFFEEYEGENWKEELS